MEIQNVDFSIEDILNMHRHWITKVYVEDGKSDVDIVGLLHERRFFVTLSQIRRCIEDWGLVQRNVPTAPAIVPEIDQSDWERILSRTSSSSPTYAPSDPEIVDAYSKKALPSIPISMSPEDSRKTNKSAKPSTDRLKATCHHGPLPSQAHDVETTLSHVPNGPSPLQTYANDEQSHELLALGMNTDRPSLPSYRRAGQPRGGSVLRPQHNTKRRKGEIILRRKKE